jgi:PKD repeat protein
MSAEMRRALCPLVLAAFMTALIAPGTASAANTARILVHFDGHTGATAQKALVRRIEGRRVATVHGLGTAVITVPAGERDEALSLLRRQSGVGYAETDGTVHAFTVATDDPLLNSSSWQLANPLFPDAWSLTTGDPSVVVAVVDTGVQADHPDLAGKVTSGYDFVNNDTDASDDNGHGTAVAGIIAAQTDNDIGISGVCWACEIMPVKVLRQDGYGTDAAVANGIVWAADHGADVINLSLGGNDDSQTLARAVTYAEGKGVVVVAAAGNFNSDSETYPAAYSGVISVGAVKQDGARYSDADWGPGLGSNYGAWVMVDAPGCTYTTHLGSAYYEYGSYFCGTSAAAPFVSGLAGLARSYDSSASGASVASAIEQSAQHLPSGNSAHGLIDADCTLLTLTSANTCPIASFTPSATTGTAPLTVSFTNTSTNTSSYDWAFGDGTTAADASPTHTFTTAGTYTVTLVASNGSSSRVANATIIVAQPLPIASFTMSKTFGRAPLEVSFENTSSNATAFVWTFGDGSPASSEESPLHIFTEAGAFTVTLTATGPGGSATTSQTITVSKPLPDLAATLTREASRSTKGRRLYRLSARLRNRGEAADAGVKATITLPAGASFASIRSGGLRCTRTRRRATCSLRALEAGGAKRISFTVRVAKKVKGSAKVAISGKGTEVSRANNVARANIR